MNSRGLRNIWGKMSIVKFRQYEYGKPSRNGYHNKEWANKMESIGLIPSHTGKEGGKKTGQNMSDYPQKGGKFLATLNKLPESYKLPFVSIEGDYRQRLNSIPLTNGETIASETQTPPKPKKKNKTKYTCPECQANIWGKPNLNVICGNCQKPFEDVSQKDNDESLLLNILGV